MASLTRFRKPSAKETRYCIYCNEELGADSTRCIYCGATLSNPLAATSEVRHDLRDSDDGITLWDSPRQPRSLKQQAMAMAMAIAVGAPGFLAHGTAELWLPLLPLGLGAAYLCAAAVTVVRCWMTQTGYLWDGTIFRSYSERWGRALTIVALWALLAHLAQTTACEGACTGQVAGATVATLVVVIASVLLISALTAMVVRKRARARGARRSREVGDRNTGPGIQPGSDPWGTRCRSTHKQGGRYRGRYRR